MKNTLKGMGGRKGTRHPLDYLSFLVRLWRVSSASSFGCDEDVIWRASVQNALDGERIYFASLDDLFSFLWQQTDAMTDVAAEDNGV